MTADIALSAEQEDYLGTIAALAADHGCVHVGDIADRLSVHKSTVTAALHRLAGKGMVVYRPYSPPTLTPAGRQVATRVHQRRDVVKRFLQEVLLVEEEVVEANACRLEHAVDKAVLDHLTYFMDFVRRCPRGGARWIRGYEYSCDPDVSGEKCERCLEAALGELRREGGREPTKARPMQVVSLDTLKPGDRGRIQRVGQSGAVTRRIADMGVVRGAVVEVIKVAPLGDPVEIKVKGYKLTLRKQEAAAINVEDLNANAGADV